MRIYTLLFALSYLSIPMALAKNASYDCFKDDLAFMHSQNISLSRPLNFTSFLPSHNIDGAFMTRARIQVRTNASPKSNDWWNGIIKFDFPLPKDQVSLPYNVFAVVVEVPVEQGGYTYFHDFTDSCTNPGLGLYPGQKFELRDLKLLRQPKGSPDIPIRIGVWGKL
jgi:hypothetical protein